MRWFKRYNEADSVLPEPKYLSDITTIECTGTYEYSVDSPIKYYEGNGTFKDYYPLNVHYKLSANFDAHAISGNITIKKFPTKEVAYEFALKHMEEGFGEVMEKIKEDVTFHFERIQRQNSLDSAKKKFEEKSKKPFNINFTIEITKKS